MRYFRMTGLFAAVGVGVALWVGGGDKLSGQTRQPAPVSSAPASPESTSPAVASASAPFVAQADPHWKMLTTYCIGCHNARLRTGGVAFDEMNAAGVPDHAKTWEEVVKKLRGGMMPPPGIPHPPKAMSDGFVAWMQGYLDAAAAANPNPGEVALHRLNRKEYANAVSDMLGLRIDPSELLPLDTRSDGFDNIADVLQTSPAFFNQYVAAARSVAVAAVGKPDARPGSQTYFNPYKGAQAFHVDGLPLGTRGGFAVEHFFPSDGEYQMNLPSPLGGIWTIGIEHQTTMIVTLDGVKVYETSVGGPKDEHDLDLNPNPTQDAINARFKNIKFKATAGPHMVGATFVAQTLSESDDRLQALGDNNGFSRMTRINSFEIRGPFNASGLSMTPSREKIFSVCYPKQQAEELPCATKILTSMAHRAFRRPVTAGDMKEIMAFYDDGRKRGNFDEGIRSGITRILASPYFLYRNEETLASNKVGENTYRLRDLDIASRLSFFLWSSIPDARLLAVAEAGKLHNPAILKQQVLRMMADPHADTLSTNFAYQWLDLSSLDEIVPDPKVFPGADARPEMIKEVELFVDSVFREDRNVVDLMTADYTFLNRRLAEHYGIHGVQGDNFRRVTLTDPVRFGLLGKGAVLMVSSYPDRTSPVRRGSWILENIVGTPPAPPPPNVSALLKDNKAGEKFLGVRERMAQHRAQPSCNACHGIMDPIGFSLENFDAIGRWRTIEAYANTPIDAHGKMADGTPVDSPNDLRNALLRNPEQFVQTLTEKLMTYALGRRIEYYDMPAVRKIVKNAAADNYRFSSIVMGIVTSDAFRLKKVDDTITANPPAKENKPVQTAMK